MAKRKRRQNTTMMSTAEGIGRTLGQLANRLDKLHKQRAAITTRIQALALAGSEVLARLERRAETELVAVRRSVKRGRRARSRMSAAVRRKMSVAAKKRHAAKRAARRAE